MKRNDSKKFIDKRKIRIFLFALGGVLLLAAAVIFIVQWKEGEEAEKTAQALLDESGIEPDEEEKLDITEYQRELTLLTCEARGNRRLVVRCKPED